MSKHFCLFFAYDLISIAWTFIIFMVLRMAWYENLPQDEQTNENYTILYLGTIVLRAIINRVIKFVSEPICKR
jgi:hypothetical protein